MKVYIAYPLKEEYLERIKEARNDVEIVENIEEAEVFLGGHISKDDLKKAKNLKWIQSSSAGIDNLLFEELLNSDIIITTASGVHPKPIAEHVFALLLSWTRRINIALRGKFERKWNRDEIKWCEELTGKTMGIIGYGKIGQEIGRIAKSFGMKVIGVKRDINQKDDMVFLPDELFSYKDLHEVLRRSDIIVLVLPLTSETKDLIGEEEFKVMKKDAIFINVGRGKTVKEDALVKALENGQIQCALLDVFYEEPLPEESPLWNLENVIITPHIAGMTPYYDDRLVEIFIHNLKNYPKVSRMLNVVDKSLGY
ncbi:MAG: D-2-hydroxyacid dehydrogenase [Dictyoglomus sp.]|uniref:D-2-hydroxyacid dehydrogenase n=1 Tax=Dictyoglomus sp. TaxID=28205 RepID=UPI000CCDC8CB|nr:MAG: D-2-hydroxyacid dehydrogenase [Dictyoglomus turgidum]